MSRAINFSLSDTETRQKCGTEQVRISVIEPLPCGGTRLVCSTVDGAEIMRRRYGKDVLMGRQERSPLFVASWRK